MSEDLTKKLPRTDSEKISLILTTVQTLETRVTNLENRVEERLYDTRPIWQKVVADIEQLHEGQRQLQEGQTRLEADMHDMKISIREITWQIGAIADSYVKVQGKTRELEGRVRDLEHQQKPPNSQT